MQGVPGLLEQTLRGGRGHHKDSDFHSNPWSETSWESSMTDNMLTKYQMIKFIDFCEVWSLPESVARVAAIVGDPRCHTPRH
ncbi:hypothetical protein TNCV_690541 [Trichonephila clavipes]|nr:hypothetical protein TNCV_690541 [Trichonephila clavipes]